MTFEQDLNTWCKETEDKLEILEKAVASLKTGQKVTWAILSLNAILISGLIMAVLTHV